MVGRNGDDRGPRYGSTSSRAPPRTRTGWSQVHADRRRSGGSPVAGCHVRQRRGIGDGRHESETLNDPPCTARYRLSTARFGGFGGFGGVGTLKSAIEIADDSRVMLCDNAPMATVRTFNTEGPVVAADHYHIPPLERIDLAAVLGLIRDKKYFVLHAPRQTGKTSALLVLRDLLNGGAHGDFRCVYAWRKPDSGVSRLPWDDTEAARADGRRQRALSVPDRAREPQRICRHPGCDCKSTGRGSRPSRVGDAPAQTHERNKCRKCRTGESAGASSRA